MAETRKQKSPSRRPAPCALHIVSDQTGGLASHLINTVLTQFAVRFKKTFHTFQDNPQKLVQTIRALRGKGHLVLHALVDPESKRAVADACQARKIPHFDLTGSLVQFIADHTGVAPVNELSRLHQVDAGYFQRIEAMEWTARHDDGQHLSTLHEADIVIVGISRVSKSPTSTYLGSMGYKTANVSLAPGLPVPGELTRVRKKVVAITIQPRKLQDIRVARLQEFNAPGLDYANLPSIIRETVDVESEYRRRGYPVIDVSDLTIEKTAATILQILKLKPRDWTQQADS